MLSAFRFVIYLQNKKIQLLILFLNVYRHFFQAYTRPFSINKLSFFQNLRLINFKITATFFRVCEKSCITDAGCMLSYFYTRKILQWPGI